MSNQSKATIIIISIITYFITMAIMIVQPYGYGQLTSTSIGSVNKPSDTDFALTMRYNSCSQNTDRMLTKLISKINENLHMNALIPLEIPLGTTDTDNATSTGNDDNSNATSSRMVTMPGLELSSFYNKRIAILGDSSLYYPFKFLASMLMHQDKVAPEIINYTRFNLGQANNFVIKNKQMMLTLGPGCPPYRRDGNKTWIQWWGMNGNAHGKTGRLIDEMFKDSEVMQPEVVVANMAFHWLQLCGYSTQMCPTQEDSPIIARWVYYKESWLQRVYDYAIKVDAKLLLFKTANFICSKRRTGDWATGDALYQSFDNNTLEECIQRVYPLAKELPITISLEDTHKFCKYGQFTDVGSQYLNEQIEDFVRNKRLEDGSDSHLVVGIFNDHDLETCGTTNDGIHHKTGNTARLRLLANTIEGYLKCVRK